MAYVGLLEDNARIAKLCSTMLQYAGHQVIVYEHPRDCLDALLPERARVQSASALPLSKPLPRLPIDVLILDLHLPDIRGIEVLNYLRAYPMTQSLPLIFCTAAAASEIAAARKIAPYAVSVEKPFTFQELVTAISTVLKVPRTSGAP
jgi:CheY-like chemotaxis protein